MNETKKVNEISSKKNDGKYSKKIHLRSDKNNKGFLLQTI